MIILLLGILVFLGIHSLRMVAPGARDHLIKRFGLMGWKAIYSVEALIGLVLIVWGFSIARPEAAFIYEPPGFMRHITFLLMWIAFIALASSVLPAGKIKAALKHPMVTSVKIWAFAHLLINGDAASLVLFTSFLAWSVWNRIAVKRRGAALPEAGPIINDVFAVVAGTLLYVLFAFWAHEFLIGVPVS